MFGHYVDNTMGLAADRYVRNVQRLSVNLAIRRQEIHLAKVGAVYVGRRKRRLKLHQPGTPVVVLKGQYVDRGGCVGDRFLCSKVGGKNPTNNQRVEDGTA